MLTISPTQYVKIFNDISNLRSNPLTQFFDAAFQPGAQMLPFMAKELSPSSPNEQHAQIREMRPFFKGAFHLVLQISSDSEGE